MAWLWFFLSVGLLLALVLSEVNHREARNKHEGCHQATLASLEALSNRAKARALRAAAEEYDSPSGQRWLRTRQRLIQAGHESPNPNHSVPAEFMLKEAEKYKEQGDV